jgi:hypothetical protein
LGLLLCLAALIQGIRAHARQRHDAAHQDRDHRAEDRSPPPQVLAQRVLISLGKRSLGRAGPQEVLRLGAARKTLARASEPVPARRGVRQFGLAEQLNAIAVDVVAQPLPAAQQCIMHEVDPRRGGVTVNDDQAHRSLAAGESREQRLSLQPAADGRQRVAAAQGPPGRAPLGCQGTGKWILLGTAKRILE